MPCHSMPFHAMPCHAHARARTHAVVYTQLLTVQTDAIATLHLVPAQRRQQANTTLGGHGDVSEKQEPCPCMRAMNKC